MLILTNSDLSTSPSVYVIYKQLSATGDCGPIGPTFDDFTKAYRPEQIQTAPHDGGYGYYKNLNYDDLW